MVSFILSDLSLDWIKIPVVQRFSIFINFLTGDINLTTRSVEVNLKVAQKFLSLLRSDVLPEFADSNIWGEVCQNRLQLLIQLQIRKIHLSLNLCDSLVLKIFFLFFGHYFLNSLVNEVFDVVVDLWL